MRTLLVLVVVLAACGDNIHRAAPDAGADATTFKCGNGAVDPGEDCDDGARNGPGDACDTTCHWTCTGDNLCDDLEPCNGMETCSDHACVAGTPLDDGTACGAGMICLNQACTAGVCGDGFTTAPEECDDANLVDGDGCNSDCTFSCVASDPTRDCTPADACAGQGTCNDTTHVCAPGTPLADDTPCGTGGYCKTGACTQPMCGNGDVEPGEQCDDGFMNGMAGDGCKLDCTFACVNPATDCGAAPACEKEQCNASHACAAVADAMQDGMPCGAGLVCNGGACIAPTAVCGNGVVETGEQCDFGAGNGPGTGCEANCTFSCTMAPDSCVDANPCNGTEVCTAVIASGHSGRKCLPGTAEADGTACGTGKICLSQVCATSTCGDGYVDAGRGETCEPPGTATCDAACHAIACGDGVRAGGEQCDDGNTTNLDGCSGTCRFEQDQRVDALSMAFAPDGFCTANALGGAIAGGYAQGQLNGALTSGVNDGSITVELAAIGLDDLTGTSDPSLGLGFLTGTHATGATTYDGSSDLDWWYATDASSIDASRTPTTVVPATIAAKVLTGGPAEIAITVSLAGTLATLDLFDSKLRANIGAASTPTASTDNMTPGHLAAEHLDPALVSFKSTSAGELCGDITAQSLASVLAPSALVGCGIASCSQCYTATNTMLDIVVGGCNTIIGTQVRATQPDTARAAGDVYTFSENAQHVVTGCKKNGATDTLADCLANAGYSSLLKFTTDRVIAK